MKELLTTRSANFFPACFILIVLLVGGTLWGIGATFQQAWETDVPILLDGAWRVLQGQRPYIDFHTPLGPVTFLIIAGGMRVAGPSAGAIGCANAILFIIVSAWAWCLSRARMTPVLSFLSALGAGLTAAGTSVYGYGFLNITHAGYAAIYNRYGEALTILVLVESFWPLRRPAGRWQPMIGGLSTGVTLALLFFLKANFFAVALALIMAGGILIPQGRSRWIGLGLGAFIVTGLLLAYLRFDIAALKHELALTFAARSGKLWHDFPRMLSDLPFTLVQVYLLFVLWWISPAPERANRAWIAPKLEQGFLALCIVGAQFLIFWTCTQVFAPTLFAWGALLILQARNEMVPSGREQASRDVLPSARNVAGWKTAGLLATIPIMLVLLPNLASIGFSACFRLAVAPHYTSGQRFASPSLAGLIVNQPYVDKVNDGLNLLRLHGGSQETILTLDYSNPFSFGLLRPSPKGDLLWWDQGVTFTRAIHLDPDLLFRDASLVMVPKDPLPNAVLLSEIYEPALTSRFTQVAQSGHWVLYRRNRS